MNPTKAAFLDIQNIATAFGAVSPDACTNFLKKQMQGGYVLQSGVAISTIPHLLSVMAQSGQLAKEGYTLQQLRGCLKVIRGTLKANGDAKKDVAVRFFLSEVKEALTLLTPPEEKHFVGVRTAYSQEVIDVVGGDVAVFQALRDRMSITEGELTFPLEVRRHLDDKMLERILELESDRVKEVERFAFTLYRSLSVRAPALLLQACPKILFSWLVVDMDEDRFLDHTLLIKEGEKETEIQVQVNKGMLAHYSEYFANIFANRYGKDRIDQVVTRIEQLPVANGAMLFRRFLANEIDHVHLKDAVALFKLGTYLLCPLMIRESFSAILKALQSYSLAFDYSHLREVDLILANASKFVDTKLLYDMLVEGLTRRSTASIERLDIEVTPIQQTMLLAHFITKELYKMAAVPSFPFPPDLHLRLNLEALEAYDPNLKPCNFYKLLQTVRELIPAGDQPKITALLEKIDWKEPASTTTTITAAAKSHLASATALLEADDPAERERIVLEMQSSLGDIAGDLFIEKITHEIEELGTKFTADQHQALKVHFAYEEVKKRAAANESLPNNVRAKLQLHGYFKVLEEKNTQMLKYPIELKELLQILEGYNGKDAVLPYLLGKIYSKPWKHAPPSREAARAKFIRALTIDPHFAEARRELDALPISPITFEGSMDYEERLRYRA